MLTPMLHLPVVMGLSDFASVRNKDAADFPGPGAYNPPSGFGPKAGTRAITIKSGFREPTLKIQQESNLGPGRYDVGGSTLGGPQYSMGCPASPGSTKMAETDIGPKYNVDNIHVMSTNRSSPRYTFGSKGTSAISPRDSGDVSHYDSLRADRASSKFKGDKTTSFGPPPSNPNRGELVRPDAALNPGPGAYALNRFGDKVPKPKMIHSHRPYPHQEVSPGPGEYDGDPNSIAKKFGSPQVRPTDTSLFGARVFPPQPAPFSPGPAAYQQQPAPGTTSPRHKMKGVSIGNRPDTLGDLKSVFPQPGPGDYSLPSIAFPTKKGCSISPRHNGGLARPNGAPGVGIYSPRLGDLGERAEALRQRDSKVLSRVSKEGNSSRIPRPPPNPGPGAYNPVSGGFESPRSKAGFSFTNRPTKNGLFGDGIDDGTPGPGTYTHTPAKRGDGTCFYKGSQ
jgi:hypothetical protein